MHASAKQFHLIVYTSEYAGDPENFDRDLHAIAAAASRNNTARNVTGTILHHQARFMEFLEGEESKLRPLIEIIARDPRHRNMKILFDDPIDERSFAKWKLDSLNLSSGKSIQLESLELIGDAYRRNFVPCTSLLVGIYKAFLEQQLSV